jgi:hypothetical protein
MSRYYLVVHLNDGSAIAGKADEATEEEIEAFKSRLGEILSNSGGWQLNTELHGDSWAMIPKQSVNYIELRKVGSDN